MDFYTGKPDRPIEHFGIVSYTTWQNRLDENTTEKLNELFANRVKKFDF